MGGPPKIGCAAVEVARARDGVEHQAGFVFQRHPPQQVLDALVDRQGSIAVQETAQPTVTVVFVFIVPLHLRRALPRRQVYSFVRVRRDESRP